MDRCKYFVTQLVYKYYENESGICVHKRVNCDGN